MRFFLGVISLALVAWTQKPSTDNSNDWSLSLIQPNSGALFDIRLTIPLVGSSVSKRFAKIKGKKLYIHRGDQSLDATYVPYFPSFEQALLEGMEQNQTVVKCIPFSGHSERDWAKRIGPIMHDLIK
ncbi:MAG: hypothetical protein ACKO4K_04110 [Flavobacteriales bacterium]